MDIYLYKLFYVSSIHLIIGLHCFCRITMSLKLPLVPKSDVKQQLTTTIIGMDLSTA